MILIDTSFLFAYMVEEDPHHDAALQMGSLIEEGAWLTLDVLKEFVTLTTYKLSNEAAVQMFNYIKDCQIFNFIKDREGFFEGTMLTFQSLGKHKFSYVDCSLIAMATELECTVLTFDKKLEEALLKV